MSSNRPSSSGVGKRSSSSAAIGINSKNVTTTNLYGYNITTNNTAGVSGKSYTAGGRPSSAGHSRPSGASAQYAHAGHILGQSISNRIASVNNTIAPVIPNINVLFSSGQASSGSGAAYARPKSAGAVRRSDGSSAYVQNSNNPVSTVTNGNNGNNMDKHQQQYMQQQLALQQQQLLQQQKVAAHFNNGLQSGIGSSSSNLGPTGTKTPIGVRVQQGGSVPVRPQSAGGTNNATNNGTFSDQYNNSNNNANMNNNGNNGNSYKMHYGSSSNKNGGNLDPNSSKPQSHSSPHINGDHGSSSGGIQGMNGISNTAADMPIGIRATRPSSASIKIRSAIDDSHKYNIENQSNQIQIQSNQINQLHNQVQNQVQNQGQNIGVNQGQNKGIISSNPVVSGNDDTKNLKKNGVGFGVLPQEIDRDGFFDETGGLGGIGESERNGNRNHGNGGNGTDVTKLFSNEDDEDTEMDGKQLSISRSHPEISTASPSLEFGLLSLGMGSATNYSNAGSTDSLQEEQLAVGLSTVPNRFCSSREAMELKKLLILSKGTRGGIVPSSTAVMDMYMVGKVVGVGSYGKVRAAWHRLTCAKVAIKTYDKAKLKDPAHWKRVHSEIKIMEQISHPRIARMYEAVETPKRMHLIMECLDGGNLCSYVKSKKRLSEEESCRIFFQILQAIEHLHLLGVTHRDVKLENVLFVDSKDCKDIKLIDFGFSTVCQQGRKLKVFCGTPSYMAPEIVQRLEYEGKAVDMWSLGILLYALLCGCFPFRAKSYPDLYRRIARGTFEIPDELSSSARDLIRQLLTTDPAQRITASSALRHPWLLKEFSVAIDMNKVRYETTILISNRPEDDIDDQVIGELEIFGLAKEEMVRLIMTKTHSSIATLYYLLMDNIINRRRQQGGARRAVSGANTHSTHGNYPINQASKNMGYVQTNVHTNVPTGRPGTANATTSSGNVAYMYDVGGAAVQTKYQYVLQQPHQQPGLQQQQGIRQEYVGVMGNASRPRSASAGRPVIGGAQRPLSAYAGRR